MAEFARRSSRTSIRSKLLGQLLVENGDATSEQIAQAIKAQEERGGMLGGILQMMGVCSADAIGHALLKQVQVTDIQCEDLSVPPEVTELVAKDFCLHEKLCPFECLGGMLCVVMGNPLNRRAITEIEGKTRMKVKAFKAVWPKISELIGRSYTFEGAPPQDEITLDLEGEPAAQNDALALDDDIIPPSEPEHAEESAGILEMPDTIPAPSGVFKREAPEPVIEGLESLDSGNAELVDMAKRPRMVPPRAPAPKAAPKPAHVNVDLEKFDQSGSSEMIDTARPEHETMEEIEHGEMGRAGGRAADDVLVALKLVPDSYFYYGTAPKNAPRSDDLLDIIEALPVAEVVAESIGGYERMKAGKVGAAGESGQHAAFSGTAMAGKSRVEFQRAPATPMAAVRLGEGEFQKSTLTFIEDEAAEWEWTIASTGPIPVEGFEE